MSRFAWDRSTNMMLAADGAEVLAYRGDDEGPAWRATVSGPVVALAAGGGRIAVLTAAGELVSFGSARGERLESQGTSGACLVAVSPQGLVATASRASVRVSSREVPIVEPTVLAFSTDGKTLAIGTASAELVFADAERGTVRARAQLVGAPAGIAHHPGGPWLATVGSAIYAAEEGTAPARVTGVPNESLTHIAFSEDGRLAAVVLGPTVIVLAYPSRDGAAQFRYLDREVVGLGFGLGGELGIGLDRGDANKMIFASEGVNRTDPHPGRERTRWLLTTSFDSAVLASAGVRSAPRAAAPVPAGSTQPPAPASRLALIAGGAVAVAVAALVLWAMN